MRSASISRILEPSSQGLIKVQRADLTCDVIKKVAPFVFALNTRRWFVNVLVTWHVSYKVTTLLSNLYTVLQMFSLLLCSKQLSVQMVIAWKKTGEKLLLKTSSALLWVLNSLSENWTLCLLTGKLNERMTKERVKSRLIHHIEQK